MAVGRHVQVYRDRSGEWRWRAIAGNGETVGDSSEGYTRKWSAKRAARRVFPGWPVKVLRTPSLNRGPN